MCLGLRVGNATDRRISVRVRVVVHGVGHRGQLAVDDRISGDLVRCIRLSECPRICEIRIAVPAIELIAGDLRFCRSGGRLSVLHALDGVQTGIRLEHVSHGVEHSLNCKRGNDTVARDRMRISAGDLAAVRQRQVLLAVDEELCLHARLRDKFDLECIAIFKCIGHGVNRVRLAAFREDRIESVAAREGDGERLSRGRIDRDRRILVRRELICIGHAELVLGADSAAQRQIVRQNRRGIIFRMPLNPERHGAAHIDHRRMVGILRIAGMHQSLTGRRARRPRNLDLIARPLGAEGDILRDRSTEIVCFVGQRSVGLHQIPAREGITVARRLRGRRDCRQAIRDDLRAGNRAGVRHADIKGHRVRIDCFRRLPNRRKNGIGSNLFHCVAGLEKHGISIGIFIFPGIAAPALEGAACERRRHIRNREALIVFAQAGRTERSFRNARNATVSTIAVSDGIAQRKISGRNAASFN